MPAQRAARVTSPVEHTSSMARDIASPAGLVIGGVIIASAIYTGGMSFAVYAAATGWAGLTASTGQILDKHVLPADGSEKIVKGVPSVHLDEPKYQAANMGDVTRTDQHDSQLETGSETVYIENERASRRGDFTECGGIITDGSPHIFYGGADTSGERPDEHEPWWRKAIDRTIAAAGLFTKPTNAYEAVDQVVNGLDFAGAFDKVPGKDEAFYLKDAYGMTR